MKTICALITLIVSSFSTQLNAEEHIPNRMINYDAFEKIVVESKEKREQARLSEGEFLQAMKSGRFVILDARSEVNFKLRHITNAVNIPFTEFTEISLAEVIPDQNTPILIYCNNNFLGSPISFASKSAAASLNVSTQASLRAYGYKNIYELGPLLNIKTTALPFSGTEVSP